MTTKMKTLGAVLTGLLAVAGPAWADSTPKEVADMECLVGNWEGNARMTLGGQSADLKVSLSCKRTPGKWGVLCTTRMLGIPGLASYEETDLFGFDPGSRKYHWFSVTNGGETHDHVADLPTGDTVNWVYTGMQEGKPFREEVRMVFSKGGNAMTLRGETFLAGKSTSVIEGIVKK
jgi:hypothetical protein